MGSNQTTQSAHITHPNHQSSQQSLSLFTQYVTKVHPHPKFISSHILQQQYAQKMILITRPIQSLSIYQKWQKKLLQIRQSFPNHNLFIPLSCEYIQSSYCGTNGVISLKYEHFEYLLSQQITNRKQQYQKFQDKQLWFLLYIIVSSAAQLHKINGIIGRIQPKNILINENGDIQLINMYTFPDEASDYHNAITKNQLSYLSPEAIQQLNQGILNNTYHKAIAESFSVGLTLLDAVLLKDHLGMYEFKAKKQKRYGLNQIWLNESLAELDTIIIDKHLKLIIKSLLQVQAESRMSCEVLYGLLKQYERQIYHLEKFQIAENQLENSFTVLNNNKNRPISGMTNINKQRIQNASYEYSCKTTKKKTQAGLVTHVLRGNSRRRMNNSINDDKKLPCHNNQSMISLSKDHIKIDLSTKKSSISVSRPQINIQLSPSYSKINKKLTFSQPNSPYSIINKVYAVEISPSSSRQLNNFRVKSGQIQQIKEIKQMKQIKQQIKQNHQYNQNKQQRQNIRLNVEEEYQKYSDFLDAIDRQLEESRRLFPENYK